MLAFLHTKKLAKCIAEDNTETDEDKLEETMAWLVLATESSLPSHFIDSSTPLEVWKLLQTSFGESRIDREVSSLVDLTGIKFSDCLSMDDYIGHTLEAWKRCSDAKVEIDDKVVALLMLGKLGQDYQPFIMGLTASGTKITVEKVKSSLLSLVQTFVKAEKRDGFLKQRRTMKGKPRCFGCNQLQISVEMVHSLVVMSEYK